MSTDLTGYSDRQIQEELLAFFRSWKPEAVQKLSQPELAAWKRHAVALRAAGFWWETPAQSTGCKYGTCTRGSVVGTSWTDCRCYVDSWKAAVR